jgi:hypothetical protein
VPQAERIAKFGMPTVLEAAVFAGEPGVANRASVVARALAGGKLPFAMQTNCDRAPADGPRQSPNRRMNGRSHHTNATVLGKSSEPFTFFSFSFQADGEEMLATDSPRPCL